MSQPEYPGQPGPEYPPQYGQSPPPWTPQWEQSPQPGETPRYAPSADSDPYSEYGSTPLYGQSPTYGQSPDYGQGAYGQPPVPATYQQGYAQPYGQPVYGYGAQPEHPQAQTVLILGILGIFVPFVQFVAWYLGGKAKKEIEAGAPFAWAGSLKTGYLLGMIFSIIGLAVAALYVLLIVVGFAAIVAGG